MTDQEFGQWCKDFDCLIVKTQHPRQAEMEDGLPPSYDYDGYALVVNSISTYGTPYGYTFTPWFETMDELIKYCTEQKVNLEAALS